MSEQKQIKPHGGKLINRHSNKDTSGLFSINISEDLASDIENIADGVFSPLEGTLSKNDFESVISKGRLANGLSWTIPVILDVSEEISKKMKDAEEVLLKNPEGIGIAVIRVEEVYSFDKAAMANGVYGTNDPSHPGVAKTMSLNDFLIGGKVDFITRPTTSEIRKYRMTPKETRQNFSDAGWRTIVAFQTRNPPHVAHEMLQKTSITTNDGVFVNPIIGKKKMGDFVDEVIVKCYETMIENYYPKNRCVLGTLHTEMKYAGPKEAIHHAIMRQNYGCTHIIIGRDHAGVGNFYDPFAAHRIFDDYLDLEIKPIFYPAFFYCKKCLAFTNEKGCPHGKETREEISGTKLREMIQNGQAPNEFILRPEVSKVILNHPHPFVD